MTGDATSTGFAPIAAADAVVLILGSLPSAASLAAREYYAHPRNAFWPIMRELAGASGDYATRCERLRARRIAVWDVLRRSVRPGSLDADIKLDTAEANDFAAFFDSHPELRAIAFNGRKAEAMFRRFVTGDTRQRVPTQHLLPSTSPAYAAMRFDQKLDKWRGIIGPLMERED